jgi:hypothetical protein
MAPDWAGSAFTPEQFDAITPPGVEDHYWSRGRVEVIADVLRRNQVPGEVLEIGCGRGHVVAALRDRGFDVTGIEPADVPPLDSVRGLVRTGVDTFSVDPRALSGVGTVLLLDVIEHLKKPAEFVDRIRAHLPGVRRIVCTVPARTELFSNYDVFNGHQRRYDPQSLRRHLDPGHSREWEAAYFFHVLYPAARLLLLAAGKRGTRFRVPAGTLARWLHRAAGWCLYYEYRVLPGTWRGTSIIASVLESDG